MAMEIKSPAFNNEGEIPKKYTCDGNNVSPEIEWSNLPDNTKSIALIADDPDAPVGTWVHWVIFNIPPEKNGLHEDIEKNEKVSNEILQGKNDFRKTGYGGPCPPAGKAHRYFFKAYALDTVLKLEPGVTKKEVETAMEGHIIEEAELIGKYARH